VVLAEAGANPYSYGASEFAHWRLSVIAASLSTNLYNFPGRWRTRQDCSLAIQQQGTDQTGTKKPTPSFSRIFQL
jgi:hypothetical protein